MSGFAGTVRFRRSFGYPGRIDPHERVWLVLEGLAQPAAIQLNEVPMSGTGVTKPNVEYDVTQVLKPRNELQVVVDVQAGQGMIWNEVALEVRCSAFLCEIHRIATLIQDRAELRVQGRVCGQADRPLDLYVLIDSSVVHYQVISATPDGTPFDIVVPNQSAEDWRDCHGRPRIRAVQVDLVNGAMVWHSSTEAVAANSDHDLGK